jgi:glutamate synthase (NADPH) large chain
MTTMVEPPLYRPEFEHDACGVGMVVDLTGVPTRRTVDDALTILERLAHRGASGSDQNSGDGAGVLLSWPDAFLRRVAAESGVVVPSASFGVAVWLCDPTRSAHQRGLITVAAPAFGLTSLGWRRVPTNADSLGVTAVAAEPEQWMQFLSGDPRGGDSFERALYMFRRAATVSSGAYAASCSHRTIILKGMLTSTQVRHYFTDLSDSDLTSSIAIVHGRFSTNTFPSWTLAQPFRLSAHNGEFNTIRGNRSWMHAREFALSSPDLDLTGLGPTVTDGLSDSASFDEVVELLMMAGRSLPHAIAMMIPEAWEKSPDMERCRRDFYRFHAALMQPWDGPASVTFCDGRYAGAVLDRNGLRPARYYVTTDQRVILASEVGVIDVPSHEIVRKGRLQPGRMFLVDLAAGRIIEDDEIKAQLASAHPYGEWLTTSERSLDSLAAQAMPEPDHVDLRLRQRLAGYGDEDVRLIIGPMAERGEEPIGSMGTDTPLAELSPGRRSVFDYFSQRFAQVTNPPLDAIREELVTSSRVLLGPVDNLLTGHADDARQLVLSTPILSLAQLAKLRFLAVTDGDHDFRSTELEAVFVPDEDARGRSLRAGLDDLEDRAVAATRDGANVLIISDRRRAPGAVALPSLLATSCVHHRLVVERLRTSATLIVETADAREVHHVAALLAFGASAVAPYLAYETVVDLVRRGEIAEGDPVAATERYRSALTKGVIKVMSKMGVSTVSSYIGSELFEAVGLSDEVLARCFPSVPPRVGGRTFEGLARDLCARVAHAQRVRPSDDDSLDHHGEYQWRRDGEEHLFNPRTVFKLQHATRSKRFDVFRQYSALINDGMRQSVTLRSSLDFRLSNVPLALDDVEPASSILRRFSTGAMSYGSISSEAHETLAVAMNRIGGKSNTGEGGEDPARYVTKDPQWNRRSAIKQVASARFGVTTAYLVNADDLQIKIAQGAKPGEGGQLPAAKVYDWIAATRHATPGVGLISPPPHHDVYSIEDLAQLIYDLRSANDTARIHVKLVAGAGVGTVAAGVAKAHADVIVIAGHDGGTGAAPLTALKHTGIPWEIGLAETQQTLARSGLRDRVVLQVDGQLRTGRDVVIAALLGADEFGFATAPLVVSGCIMMRVCHLDTCPVGIATQNPELRARFTGRPEFVETFFEYLALEVREILASLGLASLDDAIGRTDLLAAVTRTPDAGDDLALDRLLHPPVAGQRRYEPIIRSRPLAPFDGDTWHGVTSSRESGQLFQRHGAVANVDRAVGTRLGAEIVRTWGDAALGDNDVDLTYVGSAGQSFGAFLPRGVTLRLVGDANDYVAKGLSGGRVIISAPPGRAFSAHDSVIAGNVLAYGATGGELFINGVVGERLAVRNSGATVIVEGAGDHACEYMTGGVVLILGETGRNVAAGMSGGTLFVLDHNEHLAAQLWPGPLVVEALDPDDEDMVTTLLERFVADTGSECAEDTLAQWTTSRTTMRRVQSLEFQRARALHG